MPCCLPTIPTFRRLRCPGPLAWLLRVHSRKGGRPAVPASRRPLPEPPRPPARPPACAPARTAVRRSLASASAPAHAWAWGGGRAECHTKYCGAQGLPCAGKHRRATCRAWALEAGFCQLRPDRPPPQLLGKTSVGPLKAPCAMSRVRGPFRCPPLPPRIRVHCSLPLLCSQKRFLDACQDGHLSVTMHCLNNGVDINFVNAVRPQSHVFRRTALPPTTESLRRGTALRLVVPACR